MHVVQDVFNTSINSRKCLNIQNRIFHPNIVHSWMTCLYLSVNGTKQFSFTFKRNRYYSGYVNTRYIWLAMITTIRGIRSYCDTHRRNKRTTEMGSGGYLYDAKSFKDITLSCCVVEEKDSFSIYCFLDTCDSIPFFHPTRHN